MKYIVTRPQLSTFLKRRFSVDELNEMVRSVKQKIEDGDNIPDSVYDTIRHHLASKDFKGISDDWYSYLDLDLVYVIPLIRFIKTSLDLH